MSEWGKVPREVFMDKRLTRLDIQVLGILCAHANGRTGICTRRQEAIATEVDATRESVNRALKKLASLGYVHASARPGMKRSLEYRVLVSDGMAGQLGLFDAHQAPRKAKTAPRKRDRNITSVVISDITSVVTSEITSIEQTPVNSGCAAAPARDAANDPKFSEPVPTRTESAGAALPSDATGAVPSVAADDEADAVPFLAPAQPDRLDRTAIDAMENRLRTAAGASIDATSPSLFDLSAVFRWLAAGCDLDRDVLPAVAGRAARHRGRAIRTWGYFEEPVLEARQRRLALEARMAEPPTNIIPFDPRGARHGEPDRAAPRRSRAGRIEDAFRRRMGQPDAE